jgi:hypothetical protein
MIVSLVSVELARLLSRWSPGLLDRRHRIDHLLQHQAVLDVASRQRDSERNALSIRKDVALRARLAAVRGVRACDRAPLLAATEALSRAARRKSMALRLPSRSRRARWRRSHTPAFCQIAQSAPAGHAGAAAHLVRQQLPWCARAKHEQDARQGSAIRNTRSSALRLWWFRWKQRLDHRPRIIRKEGLAHTLPTLQYRFVRRSKRSRTVHEG